MGNPLYKPRPERWPQFSLRGLFLLVALVGVIAGWLVPQLKWIHDRHAAMQWLQTRPGPSGPGVWRYSVDPAANLPWGLHVLGERSVEVVSLVTTPKEHRTKTPELMRLFPEAEMNEVINWRGKSVGKAIVLDRNGYSEEDRQYVQKLFPGSTVVLTPQ